MDLRRYDWILINSSGGKDSQAMLDYVTGLARVAGAESRIVVVHADLGRVEWPGTKDLAEQQALHYGHRFEVVSRPQGDLLHHVSDRGMWPSAAARYCTSDHKRGQVAKIITKLVNEALGAGASKPIRILNCMGIRADESPSRAKQDAFQHDARLSNGKRHVDRWYPIHAWTVGQVWDRIRKSGVPHHPAYDQGMPRLSCSFCILASRSALVRAAQLRPDLAAEYLALEQRIDHTFRADLSMAEIIDEAQREQQPLEIEDWAA